MSRDVRPWLETPERRHHDQGHQVVPSRQMGTGTLNTKGTRHVR
jgi:hypothetical protein